MNRSLAYLCSVVCAFLLVCDGTSADSTGVPPQIDRIVLSGIDAVQVMVETPPEDLQRTGLTKDRIEILTKLRLRQNGLRIAPFQLISEYPTLYVNLNALTMTDSTIVYDIRVELQQDVRLTRNSRYVPAVDTWSTSSIGYAGSQRLDSIEAGITKQLDVFSNTWHEANGR